MGTYNISKLADIALVRNLAMELGPHGIRVNAICPGLVKTDFAKALWDNPEGERRANEITPMRRLGEPDDFKGIAVFLGSNASSWITGQAMTVCGGTNMWGLLAQGGLFVGLLAVERWRLVFRSAPSYYQRMRHRVTVLVALLHGLMAVLQMSTTG